MSNVGYKFTDASKGFTNADFDEAFVRKTILQGPRAWTWGYNINGQLGDNSVTSRASPVQTVAGGNMWAKIAAGGHHAAAIKVDGTLWTWGKSEDGRLGTNQGIGFNKSSPVQTVAGGTNWEKVLCGYYHTVAIKTDGTLWTWGLNGTGQLGDGTSSSRSSPVQVVTGGTTWHSLAAGWYHSAAIKTDGTLWVWGDNNNGKLGIGAPTGTVSSPVQTVAGGTNWRQVAANGQHSMAVKTDGTLWGWGAGSGGALGNNSVVSQSTPTQVGTDTDWFQVACGESSSAAIKTTGSLWMWGSNGNGQLGTNSIVSRSSPVQTVAGGTNWRQVSCGQAFTSAIKTDGTLWLWGANFEGNLGIGAPTGNVPSPVQTITGGNNWLDVSAGAVSFVSAIRSSNI